MKATKPRASTTATPSRRKFPAISGTAGIWVAGLTVVTLPVAKATIHHDPTLALAVGILPLVPYLLAAVAFTALYSVLIAVAILSVVVSSVLGRPAPLDDLKTLMLWCTNAPVAFVTLKPLSLPQISTRRTVQSTPSRPVKPLKNDPLTAAEPAPTDPEAVDTPVFWSTVQKQARTPGGRPDVVPSSAGRHAAPARIEADEPQTVES